MLPLRVQFSTLSKGVQLLIRASSDLPDFRTLSKEEIEASFAFARGSAESLLENMLKYGEEAAERPYERFRGLMQQFLDKVQADLEEVIIKELSYELPVLLRLLWDRVDKLFASKNTPAVSTLKLPMLLRDAKDREEKLAQEKHLHDVMSALGEAVILLESYLEIEVAADKQIVDVLKGELKGFKGTLVSPVAGVLIAGYYLLTAKIFFTFVSGLFTSLVAYALGEEGQLVPGLEYAIFIERSRGKQRVYIISESDVKQALEEGAQSIEDISRYISKKKAGGETSESEHDDSDSFDFSTFGFPITSLDDDDSNLPN